MQRRVCGIMLCWPISNNSKICKRFARITAWITTNFEVADEGENLYGTLRIFFDLTYMYHYISSPFACELVL